MSGNEACCTADSGVCLWALPPRGLRPFPPSCFSLDPDLTAVIKASFDQGLPILTWIIFLKHYS